MIKGGSQELQESSLIALISDPYLLSKCIPHIYESYYTNSAFKLIFKALQKYYNKYLTVPSENELMTFVTEVYDKSYGDEESITTTVTSLFNAKVSSSDFLYDKLTEFIRRNKIERSLYDVASYIDSGEVDLDKVASSLSSGLNLRFSKAPILRLSDADKVTEVREEALGSTDSSLLIKCCIDPVNWCMQYAGLIPGTINQVIAAPGTGKSTFLVNQGIATAKQGFNTLHVFLGDMKRYDGLLRYLSCLTGIETSKLVPMTDDDLTKFIKKYNMTGILGNIYIASYAPDELSPTQLIEEIQSLQKDMKVHFHSIIVDYDENFAKDTDSMYESGGLVYNKMALFATLNKSVLFIASQPKPEFWNKEILPLQSAAESSKKQKIIDTMLTIGRPWRGAPVGTLNIAKNRRGTDGKLVRLKFNGSNARITAISEDEYIDLKRSASVDRQNSDDKSE